MVELTSEWALVVVTIGLVLATGALAWFTRALARESRAFAEAMKDLADQMRRQVEVSKLELSQEADTRGRLPIKGLDRV